MRSNFEHLIRTDIASERSRTEHSKSKTYTVNGFEIHETVVSQNGDPSIPKGRYITADMGAVWNMGNTERNSAANVLAGILSDLLPENRNNTMCVCLGNRRITSDALGPLCADGITVTRHIKTEAPELFTKLGGKECSLIVPGVMGDTGIEAFDMLRAAADIVRPSAVICIDALASRSIDRLATTFQFSNAGLTPGSGIGNNRKAINSENLGVPVIAIGVPTVVHSSTLILETLEKSGFSEIPTSLSDVLNNERSFFVTLKECDEAVAAAAALIAQAINSALGINI